MIYIANPIYDAVFKYLMEDNRVARIILSALLKREVVELEMRKHEYSNGSRDKISMFRVDFAAKVRQDDGSLKLILIELQKTWLETETLRFRQYLGTQYMEPGNMVGEPPASHGLPLVTVYLLGHRVGDIEEPVLYVRHKAYNYDGEVVTKGIPDPFVESLVHDSIIVQIPLLHGYVGNRLKTILSIFDQTNKDGYNAQVLHIEETDYGDDPEMEQILHRLVLAANNAKLRQDMNVEDEYFSVIENRDTAIMQRDKRIAEQNAQLEANAAQLEANAAQLEAKDAALLASAKALKEAGVSDEQIAELTGLHI